VLLGLDTYISQAHGAGEWDDANKWLLSGVVLAAAAERAADGDGVAGAAGDGRRSRCRSDGARGDAAGGGFLGALNWGTLPLFLYMTFRRYLQAFNHVRPIAAAVVTANAVNAGLDWLLLYGHRFRWRAFAGDSGVWGGGAAGRRRWRGCIWRGLWARRCGGWTAARVWAARGLRRGRALDWARLWRLVRLGAPVGGQIFVEISIFAAVTALIGTMGPVPLAGHEIALNCVSFTFMVPFAISAAATVRVGQAVGRGLGGEAAAAGWTAIGFVPDAAAVGGDHGAGVSCS
jgi:MATE family multidrug resistance protein